MGRFAISETTIGSVFITSDISAWFLPIGSTNHCEKCKITTFEEFKKIYPFRIDRNNNRSKQKLNN